MFYRLSPDLTEQGGRPAAGRGSGDTSGGDLPQRNVSCGAAQREDPVPDPGGADPAAAAAGGGEILHALHCAMVSGVRV